MSMVRKRGASGSAAARAAKIARLADMLSGVSGGRSTVPRALRGYDRSGGFYGRFTGPGAELKFFDTANSFSFDTTGEVPATGQLNLIPQGTTESTRIGRKCVLKSVEIRGDVRFAPGASAQAATTVAMYLVLDKQCNGAAAAVTDVFTTNALTTTALVNLANSERFVILKKWLIVINATAGVTTAYSSANRHLEYFKRCNIPLEFNSTAGAITEIRSNNLFLLAGTDTNDDLTSFTGTTRVRFSDQ